MINYQRCNWPCWQLQWKCRRNIKSVIRRLNAYKTLNAASGTCGLWKNMRRRDMNDRGYWKMDGMEGGLAGQIKMEISWVSIGQGNSKTGKKRWRASHRFTVPLAVASHTCQCSFLWLCNWSQSTSCKPQKWHWEMLKYKPINLHTGREGERESAKMMGRAWNVQHSGYVWLNTAWNGRENGKQRKEMGEGHEEESPSHFRHRLYLHPDNLFTLFCV